MALSSVEEEIFKSISELMTPKVREYAKSLFMDSRLTLSIYSQPFRKPKGWDEALSKFKEHHPFIPSIIRKLGPDKISFFSELNGTEDDIERMAIWAKNLEV